MNWDAASDSIRELDEKLHKLEQVSGHDIDTLISLFAKGYTLAAPQFTTNLCPKCNGIGWVQIAPGVRGITRCPVCNGRKDPKKSDEHLVRIIDEDVKPITREQLEQMKQLTNERLSIPKLKVNYKGCLEFEKKSED